MQPVQIAIIAVHLLAISFFAVGAAVLDHLAYYYTGRIWLVLLAILSVRNGRLVFLVALLCDWAIATKDTCFVFTISLVFAQVAHPVVFTDLNFPFEEKLYLLRRHSKLSLVTFLFVCTFLHYPSWTMARLQHIMQHGPGWLWSRMSLLGLLKLLWQLPLSLFLLAAIFDRVEAEFWHVWQEKLGPSWRWLGKALYDLSPALASIRAACIGKAPKTRSTNLAGEEQAGFYTYSSLQQSTQIRVLYLLPNGNSDDVKCSMVDIDLSSQYPVFEALSYTWNGADLTHTIYVDDRPLQVTKNAHDMLRALVPVYSPRPVWIDSVCIHQDDAYEKGWQVQKMAHIYQKARRVIVWLGNAPNARLAVDLILELNHIYEYRGWNDSALYKRYSWQRRSPRWLAYGDLLEHTYFTRSWMIQEISSNREVCVVYGSALLLWKTLINVSTAVLLSHELSTYVEDLPGTHKRRSGLLSPEQMLIYNLVRNRIQEGNPMSLQQTLMECWSLQATDPRDKVFAFCDAVSDPRHPAITPDYTKPPSQVYIDTACYLARSGPRVLRILHSAGIGWPREIHPLPSWVPDWSTVGRAVLNAAPPGVHGYDASGNLLQSDFRLVNDSILELHAIILHGHVVELGDAFLRPVIDEPPGHDINLMGDRTRAWMLSARKLVAKWLGGQDQFCIHTGQPFEEVLWRTHMADAGTMEAGPDRKPFHRPAERRCGAHYRYYLKELASLVDSPIGTDQDRVKDEEELGHLTVHERLNLASLCITYMQMKCLSRRMAFTDDGYICLVPPGSLPGDKVAVIPELAIPVLLRPVERTMEGLSEVAKVFELVGECYVHGIMDGEVADGKRLERIALV